MTLKYPDYLPLLKKCKVDETRRIMYIAKQCQCMKENSELFESTVRVRQECAEILGFKSHAVRVCVCVGGLFFRCCVFCFVVF